MKRSRRNRPGDPVLFDLPLQEASPKRDRGGSGPDADEPDQRNLSLFGPEEISEEDAVDSSEESSELEKDALLATDDEIGGAGPATDSWVGESEPGLVETASVSARLVAGLADTVVHGGVVAVAVIGLVAMGIRPQLSLWPGLLLLLLAFSFLYITVPLAFWGQTPGMALCHVRARDAEDRPLTFGQTALRWLGSIITAGLLGLPLLLALSGRSLADRLSGSSSYGRPSHPAAGAA